MRGDKMMRVGAVLTIVGMVCSVIAIAPYFFPTVKLPSFWWGLSMLTGLGLALILFGLRRSSRSRSVLK